MRAGFRRWFRLRKDARSVAGEVQDEIAFHLEERTRELIDAGLQPEVARAEAERRFGGVSKARLTLQRRAAYREYRMTMREWIRGGWEDLSYSARSLSREPLIGAVIVATLALGLGANAAMFGIIDEVLLRGPAHVVDAKKVQRIYFNPQDEVVDAVTGYVTYALVRDDSSLFSGAAAYHITPERVGSGLETRTEKVGQATSDMFSLLGVKPFLGRFLLPEDEVVPRGRNVAVLDYGFWKREFGGRKDALGKAVVVNGESYTVVGVAPEGFSGPQRGSVSMWLPIDVAWVPAADWNTTWNAEWLSVVVRMKDGVSIETANDHITQEYQAAALAASENGANKGAAAKATSRLTLSSMDYSRAGKAAPEVAIIRWLLGVSAVVLLISCANVANLLLARALRRRREVSVRLALGISRVRLARLMFAESLLLATLGGALAAAIAWWGGNLLRNALLPEMSWSARTIGADMLWYGAAAILATAMLVGLAPALNSLRNDVAAAMRGGSREGGTGRSTLRGTLTVVQAALSVLLLIGAGLFIRSLDNVRNLDLGIDADRVLIAYVSWKPMEGTPTKEDRAAEKVRRADVLRRAIEGFRLRPDVENAALAVGTPFGNGFGADLRVPGYDSLPHMPGGNPRVSAVTDGYFGTAGTALLRGREFTSADRRGSEPVAIVSTTMARTLWPTEDPLTKCLFIGDAATNPPCARVIGVVEDARRNNIREEPAFQYYIPFGQEVGFGGTAVMVRPRGNKTGALLKEIPKLVPTFGYGVDYVEAKALQEDIDPQVRPWRLGATLFTGFGILALIIAGTGLFSVIAYNVTQRRNELGIRVALGAGTQAIMGLVVREGVGLASAGIAAGLLLALLAGPRIEPLLFDTSPRDAMTFACVAVALLLTAFLSSVLPALRARRVNPADVLRGE